MIWESKGGVNYPAKSRMIHESGDSRFEKVLNYLGLDKCIQTIGDGDSGCISIAAFKLTECRLLAVSLSSHLKLQFPTLHECCWISWWGSSEFRDLVSFRPSGGTGVKGHWILSEVRWTGLREGLGTTRGEKSDAVAWVIVVNLPLEEIQKMAKRFDEMAFLRFCWMGRNIVVCKSLAHLP